MVEAGLSPRRCRCSSRLPRLASALLTAYDERNLNIWSFYPCWWSCLLCDCTIQGNYCCFCRGKQKEACCDEMSNRRWVEGPWESSISGLERPRSRPAGGAADGARGSCRDRGGRRGSRE